jgi:N-acetylmuramoyl-L-alanine amidase
MKFTITAGHGAGDPGAVAADGTTEAALMVQLRDIVADKLRKSGHTVRTDGGWRENLPLPYALTLVPGSDVAVELHMNASANTAARGVEVVSLPSNVALARSIARRIAHVIESPVRGMGGWIDQSQSARGRLGFVRVGGLVVEVAFISNVYELRKVRERMYPIADAIVAALTLGG